MHRITSAIRSRTRAEWDQYFSDLVRQGREYVRQEGEKAAVVAFCLGIFIMVFYKLVAVLACLALVAYQLILIISDTSTDGQSGQ
jgi:hypothetical protein